MEAANGDAPKMGKFLGNWATKKTNSYFAFYWLFNRDPYNGSL